MTGDGATAPLADDEPTHTWRRASLPIVAGFATGVLTQLGQGLLPGGTSQVANAISPWLLVTFLVGAVMTSRVGAATSGIATLVFALIGYYALIELRYGYGASTSSLLFWGLGALVGGVVFGAAGHVWRRDPRHVWRAAALGLAGAVFVAEAGYEALVLGDVLAGGIFLVIGVLLPILLGRTRADRLGGLVAIAPAVLLGVVGYVVFTWLYGVTAGIG
jgi:hypothetical protein